MADTERLAALVRRMQAGDENATSELYQASYEDLYYYIMKTVKDPEQAADLTQETFIEIMQTIGNLQEPAAFVAWSRQIAFHKCTAFFRKRKDVLADETEDGYTIFENAVEERTEFIPDEALDKAELKQTILSIIDGLPPEQRSAILLRYFDELSVKEIADAQGVSEGTVKSRLNYGRKSIKQAVEDYEKKNGIKLRCAGVVPLLLWLFKGYAKAEGAKEVASAAADAASPALTEGLKKGAKKVGKFAVKKLVAWLTAATVVTGGVTATALLHEKSEAPKKEKSLTWCGYGADINNSTRRFDMTVEKRTSERISGQLQVSYLYETTQDSNFAGEGVRAGNDIVYTITFDSPAVIGEVATFSYDTMELTYHEDSDSFSFDGVYKVSMERAGKTGPKVLTAKAKFSGLGEDNFYNSLANDGHLFEMDIEKMTEAEIRGTLKVSLNGNTDHLTEFEGRGYLHQGEYRYEIKLHSPRTQSGLIDLALDTFWLYYDPAADTLTIPIGLYKVVMSREAEDP